MLESLRSTRPSSKFLLAAVLIGVVAAIAVLAVYGGGSFWPGLVGGFGASLGAFLLALSWERDREREQLERTTRLFNERRRTELQRRLSTVRAELEINRQSLDGLEIDPKSNEVPEFEYLHPQLLGGAWTANAPQLSELVEDYDLIADLARAYGRIEELRWRLRYRTEHTTKVLDPITAPLVVELREEVAGLLERVDTQIEEPTVRLLRSMVWEYFNWLSGP